jgi:hypothetical protein
MKYTLALALILAAPLLAQTAEVIQLTPGDAAEAKALYAQQAEIQYRIKELEFRIEQDYLTVPRPKEGCLSFSTNLDYGSARCVLSGWDYGFTYSTDFRYIVPTPPTFTSAPDCIVCPSTQIHDNYAVPWNGKP